MSGDDKILGAPPSGFAMTCSNCILLLESLQKAQLQIKELQKENTNIHQKSCDVIQRTIEAGAKTYKDLVAKYKLLQEEIKKLKEGK
jgi:hypothetical protein